MIALAPSRKRRGARMGSGLYDELVVDLFAGGGGASVGIESALGRSVDIAVNHDAAAVALHRANHPHTHHLRTDVFDVDPVETTGGRPVGLLWASPDCTFHSKARGAKPIRSTEKRRRSLAWVVIRWAAKVRPRVIALENVEEFADWCPLVPKRDAQGRMVRDASGAVLLRPCEKRKGQTFRRWVRELRRLGYAVEWRELRACDYGSPTIRKRLFVIARCDGQPIVWPEKTHGHSTASIGAASKTRRQREGSGDGEAMPSRGHAGDVDARDSIPAGRGGGSPRVRSVLLGSGHHRYRQASSAERRELDPFRTAAECIDWSLPCPSIFLTREQARTRRLKVQRPLKPATMARIARGVKKYVLDAAKPFIVVANHGGDHFRGGSIDRPLSTICGGGNQHAVVSPFVAGVGGRQGQSGERGVDRPLQTITAKADSVVVAPFTVPRYGERDGQAARCGSVEAPSPTIVPNGNGAQVVAAYIAQHNVGMVGHDARKPLSTITSKGAQQQVVAACLSHQRGEAARGCGGTVTEPVPTITAGGNHSALVYAFISSYYGVGIGQDARDPMRTIPTHERFAVVTVNGVQHVIEDIGMRMLTPRELFRCQGFGDDYIIDVQLDGKWLTKSDQTRLVGNSVCPDVAEAIVRANVSGKRWSDYVDSYARSYARRRGQAVARA